MILILIEGESHAHSRWLRYTRLQSSRISQALTYISMIGKSIASTEIVKTKSMEKETRKKHEHFYSEFEF